jgi:FdhE protein
LNTELVSRAVSAYLETAVGPDAARLRFLEGLWDIQSSIESAERPYAPPSGEAASEALVNGQTLFAHSAPDVPIAAYSDAVERIARYTSEMAGLPAEQAEVLRNTDFSVALSEERLAGAVHSPEAFVAEVAGDLGAHPSGPLTPATLAFVLISALVPFLTSPSEAALKVLGAFDRRSWGHGRCPVCGAAASMGRVGESTALKGAERVLWCGVCHAEWGYERIRCVRCGTRNPDMLRYSHLENDPAHRVHLCDECHGYAKFVFVNDLRKPLSMVVEDAVTMPLDEVAAQKDYTATGDGGQTSC